MGPRLTLVLALAACVLTRAALPPFQNPGAPPFIIGAFTESFSNGSSSAAGFIKDGQKVVVGPLGFGVGVQTIESYLSWECDMVNGSYVAVVNVTNVGVDGKSTTQQQCEYGEVDDDHFTWSWARNSAKCPSDVDSFYAMAEWIPNAAMVCGSRRLAGSDKHPSTSSTTTAIDWCGPGGMGC